AVELLKSKEWVDLTHTFGPNSPHFSAFPDAEFETLFDHDDGFFAQSFKMSGQYGTHIDAPIHFVRDTRYLEELELKELVLPLVVIDQSEAAAVDPNFTLSGKTSSFNSRDRKSTRLNSSHVSISYAVFCLKKTS